MSAPYRDAPARGATIAIQLPWTPTQRMVIPILGLTAVASLVAGYLLPPVASWVWVYAPFALAGLVPATRVFRFEVDRERRVLGWSHRFAGVPFLRGRHPIDDIRDVTVHRHDTEMENGAPAYTSHLVIVQRNGAVREVASALMEPETMEQLAQRVRATLDPLLPA